MIVIHDTTQVCSGKDLCQETRVHLNLDAVGLVEPGKNPVSVDQIMYYRNARHFVFNVC